MSTLSGAALVTLYRPVGQAELDLIRATGMTAFPPRLAHQPIFHPVLVERYAVQTARDWNTRDPASGHVGYVTRFQVPRAVLDRYPVRKVGDADALELWVPAEELADFNACLAGPIEVTHAFRPPPISA